MPLRPGMRAFDFAGRDSHAAVFIQDPLDTVSFDRELLRDLYGLTVAECRVAEAVAQGHDLNAYAQAQRISSHTARTQLKSAFRKTGARRQNQLAHLFLTGPACRRVQPAPLRLRRRVSNDLEG
jgi:DNA-binding CsgD family transcriptional regulator